MPVPGLTDIYEFADWLKKSYLGPSRNAILITPVQGGLIRVAGMPVAEAEAIALRWKEGTQDDGNS